MRTLARRLSTAILAVAVAVTTLGSPAHAANPYTPAQACSADFGGSWTLVSDGHRSVIAEDGTDLGDVYMLYNSATGYNCVTMIKVHAVGTATPIRAAIKLDIEGTSRPWVNDSGYYKYYAAIQRYGKGICAQYSGSALHDGFWQGNGRYTWGNCK